MILFLLPRTEEPLFTPETYFYTRSEYGGYPSLQSRKTNSKNDPQRWWIFECNNKRFIQAPVENKFNEIYFNYWISRHPIVYSSGPDNEFLIGKALRFLDDSKKWSEPKKGTVGQSIFNYACTDNKT